MTLAEIAEMFVRAAEIERMPEPVGPQPPRSLALPYTHDFADKAGWGTDRLKEEREAFWRRFWSQPSAREIGNIDILYGLFREAVPSEAERRALLAWANAHAGGRDFEKWCVRREKIAPETGRRRKNRALERIRSKIVALTSPKRGMHDETGGEPPLPDRAENGHLDAILQSPAPTVWRDATARPVLHGHPEDFRWATARNKRRRQREKRRRDREEKG